jgi:Integrase core domain
MTIMMADPATTDLTHASLQQTSTDLNATPPRTARIDAEPRSIRPRLQTACKQTRPHGDVFRRRVAGMGITEVITSPSSPWQTPYAKRLIGSLRRECLDHVIVLSQAHLQRMLARYISYYHGARTHLSLEKDAPIPRRVQVPTEGRVVMFSEVGGLHHRYKRRAA